jgi:hypothetical protein
MDRDCNVFRAAYDTKPFGQTVEGCSFDSNVHARIYEKGEISVTYVDPVIMQ